MKVSHKLTEKDICAQRREDAKGLLFAFLRLRAFARNPPFLR